MNDPSIYEKVNSAARNDVKQVLEQAPVKWKENARVLDIGCGDGGVTVDILQKFMPVNFMKIVGCDINQNSVDFAQEHYGGEKVQFMKLNIEDQCPIEMKGSFDHIFSFYAFHWVHKQVDAFTNVYEMLAEGGSFLIIFLGPTRVYEVFEELSRTPKWSADLKDIRTKYLSPYYNSQDPAGEVRSMLVHIGFKNVDVKVPHKTFTYPGGVDEFKQLIKCLNPFDSLKEKWEDFMEDCMKLNPGAETASYRLIVAYGSK